jgi:ribosome maturation factor RimP
MKSTVKNIAQEISNELNLFLVNVIIRGSNRKPTFEIYIDNKEGVTTDLCADFSREIKDRIDKTEFADVDYQLIVSSPGVDEPLKFLDQFYKHIDREFKISFDDGEKIQSIEAKLISISDNELTFIYKKEEIKINYNNLKKAKVKLSF